MGIVARQGIINSISSYLGILLGFLNLIVLFTQFMEPDQVGLTRVLLAVSMIGYQVSQLGAVTLTLRYFPYFKDRDKQHNGFLFNMMALISTGLGLVFLGYWIFEGPITAEYSEGSTLFGDNYYLLYPITVFLVLYFVLDRYLRSLLKTTFSQFLIEVFQRVITAALIGAYAMKWLNFDAFMLYWVLSYGLVNAMQIGYLFLLGELHLKPDFGYLTLDKLWDMLRYGLVTVLSNASQILVTRLDVILVGALIDLEAAAVYSIGVYIANVVSIPGKSISRVADTLIAEAWKNNDMDQIGKLYHKTALTQLLVGFWIFLGLALNRENIFHLMRPEYAGGVMVLIYIGLARLTDLASGINGRILVTSPYFRVDLYLNLVLVVLVVISDFVFIKLMGIDGAALATFLAITIYNFAKYLYLKWRYGLDPFDIRFVVALGYGALIWFVVSKIPLLGDRDTFGYLLDAVCRSIIITALYLPAVYFLNLSEDINAMVDKFLKRYKRS